MIFGVNDREYINHCLSSHRYQVCKASKEEEEEEEEEEEKDDEQRKIKNIIKRIIIYIIRKSVHNSDFLSHVPLPGM